MDAVRGRVPQRYTEGHEKWRIRSGAFGFITAVVLFLVWHENFTAFRNVALGMYGLNSIVLIYARWLCGRDFYWNTDDGCNTAVYHMVDFFCWLPAYIGIAVVDLVQWYTSLKR